MTDFLNFWKRVYGTVWVPLFWIALIAAAAAVGSGASRLVAVLCFGFVIGATTVAYVADRARRRL